MKVGYSKFVEGLKTLYGLTTKDLDRFKYVGDNYSIKGTRNWKYFIGDDNEPLPATENKCVCGQEIKRNAYISDGDEFLILGSKCIQHFTPNGLKQLCILCNEPHRRSKSEYCKKCDPNLKN